MLKRYRKTWLEINLDNIHHNYMQIMNRCNKHVIPVIKANAYGHGAVQVADYLVQKGVSYFAVSLLEEAIEIKAKYPSINVLVMGVISEADLSIVSDYNITFTLTQNDLFEAMQRFDGKLKCHIKVDTGMHRLGYTSITDVKNVLHESKKHQHINIEGIYTHFATSDSDKSYVDFQVSKFKKLLDSLNELPPMIHVSNTSASLKYEKDYSFTTHARVGIGLFGLSLEKCDYNLKKTFKLVSTIVETKDLNPGDKLGYGITYTAKEKEKIGILPIGYADGIIRKNQGGFVSIKNRPYQIVGRVCMDQMFVKIPHDIEVGEPVVIMGDDVITVDDVAKQLDTINYEVLCQITYRVPRLYVNARK